MSTPQTANQINANQVGEVVISETDPGQVPLKRAAAELTAKTQFSLGTIKGTRENIVRQVKAARSIPIVWQEAILAEIEMIPVENDLIRLDLHRQPVGIGSNVTFTVREL